MIESPYYIMSHELEYVCAIVSVAFITYNNIYCEILCIAAYIVAFSIQIYEYMLNYHV